MRSELCRHTPFDCADQEVCLVSTMVFSPLAVSSIRFYQRFISPYKGFRCAHGAARKGWSCSEFGRRAFARYDVSTAYALLQRRFAVCKASFETLKATHFAKPATVSAGPGGQTSEAEKPKKKDKRDYCDCVPDAACDGPFSSRPRSNCVPDAATCDVPDISVCDCSL
jgi:uncharacterized protein